MERTKGILAAMWYLGQKEGWRFEVDEKGARLTRQYTANYDCGGKITHELVQAEVVWGRGIVTDLRKAD